MNRNIFLGLIMLVFLSCRTTTELPTVKVMDINQYAGTWYEIARLPNGFEKKLDCVTATYSVLENGKIEVLNKGRLKEKNNKIKEIKGKAWVPDNQFPGRLKVRFFWPFSGDYYIIALGENYNYALVGDPSRKYLWVLSKESQMDEGRYAELLEIAVTNGFNIEAVMKVNQKCD